MFAKTYWLVFFMSKADNTRKMILGKAFELIYKKGFQATSIDDIIATTAVTKGAFFYHFKNKDDMGLAMIKEVIQPGMMEHLVHPLMESREPVAGIYNMMKHILLESPFFQIKYGCPAVNLVEEMAPLNASFQKSLQKITRQWQEVMAQCLEKGKEAGKIRKEINCQNVACFITAGYSGIRNMGKTEGRNCYAVYLQGLKEYLAGLS